MAVPRQVDRPVDVSGGASGVGSFVEYDASKGPPPVVWSREKEASLSRPTVVVVEAQERRRGSVTVTFGGVDGASSVRLLCYDQETAERLFALGARFEMLLRRLP